MDTDFQTVIGDLIAVGTRSLSPKLNDVGGGQLIVPVRGWSFWDRLDLGQFVALNYPDYQGGFLIENIAPTDAQTSKDWAGKAITISGRGPLALLEDAMEWDWSTPDMEDVRHWGTGDTLNMYGDGGAPVTPGSILFHLLDEAQNMQTLPWPPYANMERYCWYWPADGTSGGRKLLTWDFDAVNDSNGAAWTASAVAPVDIDIRTGTSLLDTLKQFAKLGYDFSVDYDPTAGQFTLHGYGSKLGSDLSGSVLFQVGVDCEEVSRKESMVDVRTSILTEYNNSSPFIEVTDPTAMLRYRRREGLLEAANATTPTTATQYGQAELDGSKLTTKEISIKVSDLVSPQYGIDYHLADTILYNNNFWFSQAYRITGAILEWNEDNPAADVTMQIQSPQQ